MAQAVLRRHSMLGPSLAIAGTLSVPGVAVLMAGRGAGPTLCAFRLCTGQACPGCGMTRAIGAAIGGDLSSSWRYHPLALVVMGQLVIALVALTVIRRPTELRRWLAPAVAANAVLLVLTWLIRWRLGLLDFVVADG